MTTKSKEGQKFWHLKKLALGNKSNEPSLQRPPSPAESTFSVDVSDDPKPRSKRLSVLLSSRRTVPSKGGLPTAMSVQNLRELSDNKIQPSKAVGSPPSRQRTMSQTAAMAGDTRASLLRTRPRDTIKARSSEELSGNRAASPPSTLPHRASMDQLDDQRKLRQYEKPNAIEDNDARRTKSLMERLSKKRDSLPQPSPHAEVAGSTSPHSSLRRSRTLRPASSFASLRSTARSNSIATEEERSTAVKPPLAPTSPPVSPRLVQSNTVQNMAPRSPKSPRPRPFDEKTAVTSKPQRSQDPSWSGRGDENEGVTKEEDGSGTSSDSDHSLPRSEAYWEHKLEKERAVVEALQRQKEACNKDIAFLSQTVDEISTEKQEWKQKYEAEKMARERFESDLSSTCDQLNKATEQVHHMSTENSALKQQLEKERAQNLVQKEQFDALKVQSEEQQLKIQEQQEQYEQLMQKIESQAGQNLAEQLKHSQDQVRVLKATMEQFLRMGIFSDNISVYQSIATRFPTTEKASAVEEVIKEQESFVPEIEAKEEHTPVNLEMTLRELVRERDLLQADYSKIPISGANALVRRRKEDLEMRLDKVDSDINKIKLKMKQKNALSL